MPNGAVRINCGGGPFTDAAGAVWSADTGHQGGGTYAAPGAVIANTPDAALYRDVRNGGGAGHFGYTIPVANGPHVLRLHFAELYYTQAGRMRLNVAAQGRQILSNFDVFGAAGGQHRAVVQSFPVTVTGGQLTLAFTGVAGPGLDGSAQVSAIEVLTARASVVAPGSWQVLPYSSRVLAIHAALLHTGRVLFFSGAGIIPPPDGAHPPPFYDPVLPTRLDANDAAAVWDVGGGDAFTRPTIPNDAAGRPVDLFCAGHSALPDGRLLVAGGTRRRDAAGNLLRRYEGLADAVVFDPVQGQWAPAPAMAAGRWYPTLLTLGDGRVLAVSGALQSTSALDDTPGLEALNQHLEVFAPAAGPAAGAGAWTRFAQATGRLPMYPHLFLLRDGRVFYAGGYMSGQLPVAVGPRLLTLPPSLGQPIGEQPVEGLSQPGAGDQATSVLLPPAQAQQVMFIGGGNTTDTSGGHTGHGPHDTTARVAVADLSAAVPRYADVAPLNGGRMHHNAVLLPDRTVLVCGGGRSLEAQAALEAEVYDPYDPPPAAGPWRAVATATVPRLYHSVALLLPDGRVVAAGSNPPLPNQVPSQQQELRLEVYSPGYMAQPRPVLQTPPQQLAYGQALELQTPQAEQILWASLIRPGVVTHSFNTGQRLIDLPIISRRAQAPQAVGLLRVAVPNEPNLAPPGWYMLFIADDRRVPSVAAWVRLSG